MAAPTFLPEWANDDVNLPNTGNVNKLRPDSTVRTVGLDVGQKPTAEELNWQFNNLFDWVEFFNTEGTANSVIELTQKVAEPAAPAVAVLYIDIADGDLKVKFADSSVVNLAAGPV